MSSKFLAAQVVPSLTKRARLLFLRLLNKWTNT